MIIHRLANAIRNQNWSQIITEILIVVIGIFLGLQVQAWYDTEQDKEAYSLVLDRLLLEYKANMGDLQISAEELADRMSMNEAGFDALLSCMDSTENMDKVNVAFTNITGTMGIRLRSGALDEITENQRFLDLQSSETRSHFSNFRRISELWARDADDNEYFPLEERIENNALISIAGKGNYNTIYHGFELDINPRRILVLNAPISIACKDNDLVKSFYTWERWQGLLMAELRVFETQYKQEIKYLEDLTH